MSQFFRSVQRFDLQKMIVPSTMFMHEPIVRIASPSRAEPSRLQESEYTASPGSRQPMLIYFNTKQGGVAVMNPWNSRLSQDDGTHRSSGEGKGEVMRARGEVHLKMNGGTRRGRGDVKRERLRGDMRSTPGHVSKAALPSRLSGRQEASVR